MNIIRFLTLMLCTLALAAPLAHFFELPAKMSYDGAFYLQLQHGLYRLYGAVGGIFEVGAVLMTLALAWCVRDRGPVFYQALTGAAMYLIAHVVFWIFIAPMNAQFASWTTATMPENWTSVRDQWEYSHAARAILEIVGLSFIISSVLSEIPDGKRVVSPARASVSGGLGDSS